ncbi:MAG TPA: methanogenesis marker 3 protein [Euryarchaeota archaeon]|nr:methanogenesis marker 3 protein [Euryarchaeota archaeon]
MLIRLNGREVEVADGTALGDAIKGEPYMEGTQIALTRSVSSIQKGTQEFEVSTPHGSFVIRTDDSENGKRFRELVNELGGVNIRWKSSKVIAYGSFPTDLEVSRESHDYSRYDCFFALGGFDNRSTYIMIARIDQSGSYGVAGDGGKFGKVTRGRFLLDRLREGDPILSIRPVVLELSETDAFVTTDLSTVLEDGMSVETYVGVDLDRDSPVGCEQFLVVAAEGRLRITERTETYSANSQRMDVSLVPEKVAVREVGDVTVRNSGAGTGRIYFYRERRQQSPNHTLVGKVTNGQEIVRMAPQGTEVTLRPNPPRIMTIGMTQAEAAEFLSSMGLVQKRTGSLDDDAIVVEQEPELTMEIVGGSEVETRGIHRDKVVLWEPDDEGSPTTTHYIRKMTGLDHKPIGTLKVFFTFEGMPMITFVGNPDQAAVLLPEKSFAEEGSFRGQVAVTNMSRPNRGSIGVRLEDSDEFGPTGEEAYGTNVAGRIVSDLELMMKDIKDGDIVYIAESRRFPGQPAHAPEGPMGQEGAGTPNGHGPGDGSEEISERPEIKGGRPRAKRPKPE